MKKVNNITLAIADDHVLVREALVALLETIPEFSVVIQAGNGLELLEHLRRAKDLPDICLLDLHMPEMDGFQTIVEMRKIWPAIKVLVLSISDLEFHIIRMIVNGANGYLLKNSPFNTLCQAITAVVDAGVYYSDVATRHYFNAIRNKTIQLPNLTAKELEVLRYCCSDLSYAEIASKMATTSRSVEGYRDSLFRKLNVNSRVSLALFAVNFGLVPLEIGAYEERSFHAKQMNE